MAEDVLLFGESSDDDLNISEVARPQLRTYKKVIKTYSKKSQMSHRERVGQKDFGKYQPHQRINVDQVPFILDNQPRKSYVSYKSADHVQISAPDGANKRFGTLQIAFHGGGRKKKQLRLMMFFRGEGGVYDSEKFSYHPDVDVVFQTKAWMDKTVSPKWITRTLKRWVDENLDNEHFILAQDNLGTQKDFELIAIRVLLCFNLRLSGFSVSAYSF